MKPKVGRPSPVGGTVGVRVSRGAASAARVEAAKDGSTVAEVVDSWKRQAERGAVRLSENEPKENEA